MDTNKALTPEQLVTLRLAFDFSKRQVLAELEKLNPPDVAKGIFERCEPTLNATASGLLDALANGTDRAYLEALPRDETTVLFCRLCLENATDIIGNITPTE